MELRLECLGLTARKGSLKSIIQTHLRVYDGIAVVVLFFISQLLVCGLYHFADKLDNFPSAIMAMLLVAVILIGLGGLLPKVDGFYKLYLRVPVGTS